MEKKKINVATLVIVTAIVLIAGVIAGVFIGKNMSQVQIGKKGEGEKIQQENKTVKNEITENGTIQTNIQDNKGYASSKQEARKELDINSEQIKKLYSYIPACNMGKIEKNAYQTSKTTKDDISISYLLANAFRNIRIEDKDKEYLKDESGQVMSDWYQFDSGILQAKVKEMYGENIKNESFDFGCQESCNYNNGKYSYGYGGRPAELQENIRKMMIAYEENGEIYIEDTYICVKKKDIIENNSYTGKQQVDIYPSSNSKEALGIDYYNTTGIPTYKHTFKKNKEGNYYWYSTEEQLEQEKFVFKFRDDLNGSTQQTSNSNNTYEIETIKNIYDVIDDKDTNLEKAQKIAKEVMNTVNNKDWYYLAKLVGTDADYFIKYGIYNYNIDISDYREINGAYIFNEKYETSSQVNEALGKLLIIKFEDGGRILIDPNSTGI